MDKLGFKFLMIIISILELIVSLTIFYIANNLKNELIYIIENLIIALCLSGTFTMITPTFSNIFGRKGAEIYGITGFMIGVASFLGPVLTKIFIRNNGVNDYKIVYFSGGGFVILNLVFIIFFEEKPFVFQRKDVDDKIFERLGHSNNVYEEKIENEN